MKTLNPNEIFAVAGGAVESSSYTSKLNFTYVANELQAGAVIGALFGFFIERSWTSIATGAGVGAGLSGGFAALSFAAYGLDRYFELN